jgi:CMP-N-acetylneuraminic acid synthetase
MFYMEPTFNLSPLLGDADMPSRRQDSPQVFGLNGAVYAAQCEWLSEQDSFVGSQTRGYEMPASRSLDIDSEFDFALAEALIT